MNLNQVNLIGRVTRDPEVKALPSGVQVASFSLATNRVYRDKDDKKVEQTDFHNVVAFGRVVESVIAQYVKKGQLIYVGGRLQTRSWEDKNSGEKKYRTEIILETIQLGPRASNAKRDEDEDDDWDKAFREPEAGAEEEAPENESPRDKQARVGRKNSKKTGGEDDINPDDIPF